MPGKDENHRPEHRPEEITRGVGPVPRSRMQAVKRFVDRLNRENGGQRVERCAPGAQQELRADVDGEADVNMDQLSGMPMRANVQSMNA